MKRTRMAIGAAGLIVALGACVPSFGAGAALQLEGGAETIRVTWPAAVPAQEGQTIDEYEVLVDGVLVSTVSGTSNSCMLSGLEPAVEVTVTVRGVDSLDRRTNALAATAEGPAESADVDTYCAPPPIEI